MVEHEQQQWELKRLGEVEGFIQKKAYRFCMDDPMLEEDLAQEAREAVVKRLRENPGCPDSHLVRKAYDAIFDYRARGISVDGKLNPVGRKKKYHILNLEDRITDDTLSLAEALADQQSPRHTEDRACRNIFFEDLRECLSAEEYQLLNLRLSGASWLKAGEIMGQSIRQITHIREVITVKLYAMVSDVI